MKDLLEVEMVIVHRPVQRGVAADEDQEKSLLF